MIAFHIVEFVVVVGVWAILSYIVRFAMKVRDPSWLMFWGAVNGLAVIICGGFVRGLLQSV